jgi:hypothetical protein
MTPVPPTRTAPEVVRPTCAPTTTTPQEQVLAVGGVRTGPAAKRHVLLEQAGGASKTGLPTAHTGLRRCPAPASRGTGAGAKVMRWAGHLAGSAAEGLPAALAGEGDGRLAGTWHAAQSAALHRRSANPPAPARARSSAGCRHPHRSPG